MCTRLSRKGATSLPCPALRGQATSPQPICHNRSVSHHLWTGMQLAEFQIQSPMCRSVCLWVSRYILNYAVACPGPHRLVLQLQLQRP